MDLSFCVSTSRPRTLNSQNPSPLSRCPPVPHSRQAGLHQDLWSTAYGGGLSGEADGVGEAEIDWLEIGYGRLDIGKLLGG